MLWFQVFIKELLRLCREFAFHGVGNLLHGPLRWVGHPDFWTFGHVRFPCYRVSCLRISQVDSFIPALFRQLDLASPKAHWAGSVRGQSAVICENLESAFLAPSLQLKSRSRRLICVRLWKHASLITSPYLRHGVLRLGNFLTPKPH